MAKKGIGEGFDMNTDISSLHADKKATPLSKWVFWLGVLGLWVMFIPSMISLFLAPRAKAELHTQSQKQHSSKMISWGIGLSWAGIIMNIVGGIILIVLFYTSRDIFEKACSIQSDLYYCNVLQQVL